MGTNLTGVLSNFAEIAVALRYAVRRLFPYGNEVSHRAPILGLRVIDSASEKDRLSDAHDHNCSKN